MDFGETYNVDVFHTYSPQKVHIGNLHPDPVVETSYLKTIFYNHSIILENHENHENHESFNLIQIILT